MENRHLCSHCGKPLGRTHKILYLNEDCYRYHSDCFFELQPEIERNYLTKSYLERLKKQQRQEMLQHLAELAADKIGEPYHIEESGQSALSFVV